MKRFTDIESLKHIVKRVRESHEYDFENKEYPTIDFIGTVKLHGTNVGVRRYFENEEYRYEAQGRNVPLTIEQDNYEFAQFVSDVPREEWDVLFLEVDKKLNVSDAFNNPYEITIFGEWIGKGIQKKVAVSKLERQFVIFDVFVKFLHDSNNSYYFSNVKGIECHAHNIFNIYDAPTYEISIDFKNPRVAAETLEKMTLEIDAECPWGKLFGVDAPGEGIVWRPKYISDSSLYFKTKGNKHKPTKEDKLVPVDPQVVENINQCVDVILSLSRLEQGIDELFTKFGKEPDIKELGEYLKWVGQDCKKEEMITIEANNLTWREVSKEVMRRAKEYFIKNLNDF